MNSFHFLSECLLSTYELVTLLAALKILENKTGWGAGGVVYAFMMLTFSSEERQRNETISEMKK